MKKLSIITINYNNCDGLRKTIESVVAQTIHNFEYIVIDGGSTDGSVDVIKEYVDYIDYWVSEPDKGIYNAMNKGVKVACGLYCQFLNSGDWLYSDASIESIFPSLNGDIDIISSYTNVIEKGKIKRLKSGSPQFLSLHGLLCRSISHPSSFIKSEVLRNRPYDETLKIVSDWKFFIDCYINKATFQHIDCDVAFFDTTGISSNAPQLLGLEKHKVLKEIPCELLFNEVSCIPTDVVLLYSQLKKSFKAKKLITNILKAFITLYNLIKATGIIPLRRHQK